MRLMAVSGIALLSALLAPGLASEVRAQSFLGEWTATAETPAGSVSETLTVTKTDEGYAITAKLVGVPDGTLVITYTGVVSGDTFTGPVAVGGVAQAPYTGVRRTR